MAAYDSGDVSLDAQAQAWVDGVNSGTGVSGGWRLQLLRLRSRRRFGRPLCDGSDGTLPAPDERVLDANGDPVASVPPDPEDPAARCLDEAPVRLRRFVSGCPWALVDRVIRILHREAPYRGIVYNGVKLAGAYRPTKTEWLRDEQAQSPGERGSLGTYTLVQDLVEIKCCDESDLYPTGGSCLEAEETLYVWDADSVQELPLSCEQGVSYSIRAVQRDEDGLFSYQLVKSTARTKAWGPVRIECGPMAVVTEWGWRNLYGDPDTGFQARGCDGELVSVSRADIPPVPVCDQAGMRTEAQWQINGDCTWDVRVRRREARQVGDSWVDGTSCRAATHDAYRNYVGDPRALVPAPNVGERVSAEFRRNEDSSLDGTVVVTEAPEPVEFGWTDGTSCRPRHVTVLEDQRVRPGVPDVGPGESLDADLRRNEDCTWTARFSVTEPQRPETIAWREGSSCRPVDVVRHVAQAAKPEVPEPPAGGRVDADVQRNADCTYDARIATTHPYSGEPVEWEDGASCRRRRHTLYIDAVEKPGIPSAGPGETVDANIRFDPSNCTWAGEVVVTDPQGAETIAWREGSACRPVDVVRHVAQTERPEVPEPPAGGRVDADVQRNADCTYDARIATTHPYAGAPVEWEDGASCRRRRHTLYVDSVERPSVPSAARGETVDANIRFDPSNCTWAGEVVVAEPLAPETIRWADGTCMRPADNYRYLSHPSYEGLVPPPGESQSVSADIQRNPDCTYDARVSVTRPNEKDTGWITWDSDTQTANGTMKYHHGYRAFFNKDRVPTPTRGSNVNINVRLNEFCQFDGEMTYSDLYEWSAGGGSGGGIRTRTQVYYVSTDTAVNSKTLIVGPTGYVNWRVEERRVFTGSGNEGSEQEVILDGGVQIAHGVVRGYLKTFTKRVKGITPPDGIVVVDIPQEEKNAIAVAARNNPN